MDLDKVADELYGLPREAFTAARNRHAAEARRNGNRELAGTIQRLRRPTASAWLANLLVRRQPDEVGHLLQLGEALRAAQEQLAADDLRRLFPQRRRVVLALRQQAERLADEAGQPVSDTAARELESTLEAALADPDAGRALQLGRLTEPLRYSGLGAMNVAWPDGPASQASRPARKPGRRHEEQGRRGGSHEDAEGQRAVEDARRSAAAARKAADAAGAEVEAAREALAEHDRRRSELEARLAEAQRRLDGRRADAERADATLAEAEKRRTRARGSRAGE